MSITILVLFVLMGLQGLIFHIIIVYIYRHSFICGKCSHICLLNSITARMGSPALNAIDDICDGARLTS